MATPRLYFTASEGRRATRAYAELCEKYPHTKHIEDAELIIALGGDGFMLRTLHEHIDADIPVYGMNCGTVGFLMNECRCDDLLIRLQKAQALKIHPLRMKALTYDGKEKTALAFNEVSLFRQTHQAAYIDIKVDGISRLEEMICDGVLLATPAGSTAYNLSAHGPVIPVGSDVLALTPISSFRPRRWRGALLPNRAHVEFSVRDCEERPVSAVADVMEVRNVVHVSIREDKTTHTTLLFDPEHNMEERILREQFAS